MNPALQGGFLTTEPPGKPLLLCLLANGLYNGRFIQSPLCSWQRASSRAGGRGQVLGSYILTVLYVIVCFQHVLIDICSLKFSGKKLKTDV